MNEGLRDCEEWAVKSLVHSVLRDVFLKVCRGESCVIAMFSPQDLKSVHLRAWQDSHRP